MQDYEYLIHLLYCVMHGTQPAEKPPEVSFENVLKLAKSHEVAGMAFVAVEQLKDKPQEETYRAWQLAYYFSVQRDSRQAEAHRQVRQALHKQGIRTLEAQGTVTKTLYPSPELRTMSDIDIIIDIDNLPRAMEMMQQLGYRTSQKQPVEFDAVLDGELLVEFHTDFFNETMFNRRERYAEAITAPFDHAVPDADDPLTYVLEDTWFYLYSVLHILKHFETVGCGIRRVMDLYYFKQAYADRVDMALIDRVLDGNGFRESYELLSALEGEWFEDTPSPTDLTETKRDVLMSGTHGTSELFIRNNLRKDKDEGVRFAKLKRVWRFIFPTKAYLYLGYPVCRERGYSLFVSRLYRIGHTLRRFRFTHAIHEIKMIMKSK